MPFHELYIKGRKEILNNFFLNIEASLNKDRWSFREDDFLGRHFWFFEYIGGETNRPHVEVSITDKANTDYYYVPNIVPIDVHEISKEEYNSMLDYFRKDVLDHYNELSSQKVTIELDAR